MGQYDWTKRNQPEGIPSVPGITPEMISGQLGQAGASKVLGNVMGQTGGGILSNVGGILGKLSSFAGPVGSLFELGKGIASLFRPSVQGIQKQTATANQEDIQKRAQFVEQQVNAGAMDPVAGLREINGLYNQLSSLSGASNEYDKRGISNALMLIQQIRANLQQKVNWGLTANPDKGSQMGLAGVSTDPEFQKQWTRNAIVNKLAGFERGNQQLAGSPLERMFKGPMDVQGGFQNMMKTAGTAYPTYQEPGRFEELRKKLWGGGYVS